MRKTSSILTTINIVLCLLMLPLLAMGIYKLVGVYDYLPMNCMSTVHINYEDSNNVQQGIKKSKLFSTLPTMVSSRSANTAR